MASRSVDVSLLIHGPVSYAHLRAVRSAPDIRRHGRKPRADRRLQDHWKPCDLHPQRIAGWHPADPRSDRNGCAIPSPSSIWSCYDNFQRIFRHDQRSFQQPFPRLFWLIRRPKLQLRLFQWEYPNVHNTERCGEECSSGVGRVCFGRGDCCFTPPISSPSWNTSVID